MAKITFKKSFNLVMWLVGVIVGVGVGGLFLNGTFLNTFLLKLLPLLVHQITGWLIIATTLIAAIAAIMKKL